METNNTNLIIFIMFFNFTTDLILRIISFSFLLEFLRLLFIVFNFLFPFPLSIHHDELICGDPLAVKVQVQEVQVYYQHVENTND